jgi:hypothetical protein
VGEIVGQPDGFGRGVDVGQDRAFPRLGGAGFVFRRLQPNGER